MVDRIYQVWNNRLGWMEHRLRGLRQRQQRKEQQRPDVPKIGAVPCLPTRKTPGCHLSYCYRGLGRGNHGSWGCAYLPTRNIRQVTAAQYSPVGQMTL